MKMSKIKNKLDKLLNDSAKKKSANKNFKAINSLLELLNQKQHILRQRALTAQDDIDIQKYKRKLKLVKLQINKAKNHILELKS